MRIREKQSEGIMDAGKAGGRKNRHFGWKQVAAVRCRQVYENVRVRTAVLIVFALAWWGILYPELCFTENTFRKIVVEDGEEKPAEEAEYREIMDAVGDEVVIGSRILEWLEERDWFRHGG